MSAYSFEPRSPVSRSGSGGGSPSIPPLISVVPVYRESATDTDGVATTFSFSPPIGALLAGFIGGQAQLLAECAAVAGALVLSLASGPPGDPANVGLIKVSALYIPA